MKKILGLIFNRWTLLAFVLTVMLLIIWLIGPIIAIGEWHPLDGVLARWVVTGVLLVFVAAMVGWRIWQARRGNQKVVEQLMAAPAGGPATPAESADMAAVRQRFETALKTLRTARFGKQGQATSKPLSGLARLKQSLAGRFLYELPWYTIIGAPGSGKTTVLLNAGLTFPPIGSDDKAVKGIGGTRNCDWWFTDQAVLIDTAGRFVTQDSDQANDKATWAGFLQLLKRSRPRQPINGVLVAVSIAELIAKSPTEKAHHAQLVRARMQELHEQLGVRFPIYLLVTKCDLLAGFTESFAALDKDQRAAPWGYTVPLGAAGAKTAQEALVPEFDALLQRLNDGLVDRLQAESDPQRRARIYGFPNQFAALRESLQEFVQQVFSPSPFEAEPMLRGVYFVSGTQEGSPIDRVLGSVARQFRLEQVVLPPQQASGRSFFLSRLLTEVIFAEHGLAGTNRLWERRRGALAIAGYAAIAIVTLGVAALWGISYSGNSKYIDAVAARVNVVRKGVTETPNRPTPDLRPLLGALDATRSLAAAGQRDDGSVPWSLGFGLYQGGKLDAAANLSYERMLVDAVLPRLAMRVEEQLRAGDQAESQYEALKAYLMMYDPQRFDAAALKAHFENDWDVRLGRELSPEQREAMSRHLDALLARGPAVSPLPQDKALVEATRSRLATVSLAQRVYNRLRQRGLGDGFPEFTVAKAGGGNAALVFVRTSGQPLTKGVPGLFSYNGYYKGFQSVVGEVTKQLADEQSWVLGIEPEKGSGAQALLNPDKLSNDVRKLYLLEYKEEWRRFILDIRLQPVTSLAQSVDKTRILAAADSPLPPLLKAMSRETTLLAGQGLAENAEQKIKQTTEELRNKVLGGLGAKLPTTGAPTDRVESIVDDEFKDLRRMVTAPEGGKAPIDALVGKLGELQVLLTAVKTAVDGGSPPPPSPLPNEIKATAATTPEPLRSLLESLGNASSRVASMQLRESLSREVRAQVGEFCSQAIAGRYPFDPNSSREVTQADFASLFGPGGKFEQMQNKLGPYIDTSTKPWSFRLVEGTPLGSDSGTLPQFQKAAVIRETFFNGAPAGSTMTRLEMKPVEMDAALREFTLDVDGQIVRYSHGPQIPTSVSWPSPKSVGGVVRLMVQPAGTGMVNDGPWALYKMFDRVSILPGGEREKFRAVFDIDGRKATFDVTTSSVRNPFRLNELRSFSCPNGL